MATQYVAIARNDVHELRRMVKAAIDSPIGNFEASLSSIDDFLTDLDVLKLDAAINQEIGLGNLTITAAEVQ